MMAGSFTTLSLSPAPMSDKSTAPPDAFFAIPGHRVLAMEGRDALKFAQAQFTTDVQALEDGHWQWSGWLTPKGRVIALFALLRLGPEQLWLVLPDADPAALVEQLQRFVFRSKVKLHVLDEVQAAGAFAGSGQASGARIGRGPGEGVELDMGGEGGRRTLRLSDAAASEDPDGAARWAASDLAHGLPRLDAGQAEQWTPQQLSLQRLRGYSVKKGCYPGQEIVARTHFLGQAKRGLARLQVPQPVTAGTAVTAGGSEIGRVVCAAGSEVLAVLPLELPQGPLDIAGAVATPAPMLDGLAR